MPLLARFFGGGVSTAVGVGIGGPTGSVLEPAIQDLRNFAWNKHQTLPIEAYALAQGVSQGQVDLQWARDEATLTGIDEARFDTLVDVFNTGPGVGEAFRLRRRGLIEPDRFRAALRRNGIEKEWIDAMVKVVDEILTPGELAAAIHRGLVPDAGLLLGEQPEPPFKVQAYPVQPIAPIKEAAGSGYDEKRLQVLVGLQGLPMGPHEAAQALFRGVITHGDYIRAFNTSNMRNEWAQAILDQSRQIPTARDFLENALRGYSNLQEAIAGAARHGMSKEDATLIYQNQGRPMNIHQITQALARGAKFNPEPGELRDPYDASIVEGPIKPAYYEMAKSLRYTLPSIFTMRALAESGVWSEAKTAERLKWAGWLPEDADEAAKAWTTQGSTTSKGLTVADLTAEYEALTMTRTQYINGLKELGYSQATAEGKISVSDAKRQRLARNQLIGTARLRYTSWQIARQTASDALRAASLTAANADALLTSWDLERELKSHGLTEAQIVKAFSKGVMDRATAEERLTELGLHDPDIATRLDAG